MASLTQLTVIPDPDPNAGDLKTNAAVDAPRQTSVGGGDDVNDAPMHSSWTNEEILVLLQAKRMAANLSPAGFVLGSGHLTKWKSVSSYCITKGVNRSPIECRNSWIILAGDYKKIKIWETQTDKSASFWASSEESRKRWRLPVRFDKMVYDRLDEISGIFIDVEAYGGPAFHDELAGLLAMDDALTGACKMEGVAAPYTETFTPNSLTATLPRHCRIGLG